jgi:hypothetical protein
MLQRQQMALLILMVMVKWMRYLFIDIKDESVGYVFYAVNYSFLYLEPRQIGSG